jgi:hypothetical protein
MKVHYFGDPDIKPDGLRYYPNNKHIITLSTRHLLPKDIDEDEEGMRFTEVYAGAKHCYLLDWYDHMYGFGLNDKGQLLA